MVETFATRCSRVVCVVLGLAALASLAACGLAFWKSTALALLGARPLGAIAAGAAVGAVLAWRGHAPGRLLARVPAPVFLAVAVAIALASGLWAHAAIHKGVPDVPDEMGYLHQARTFADGHLVAPSPPARDFYYASWSIHDGDRWYAVFPPGYGALLAIGVALGSPAMVNAVLGALLVLVLYGLGRCAFAPRDGSDTSEHELAPRLAVVLYLASWFRLMQAGSLMAHPTAALFTALTVLGVWRAILAPADARRAMRWAAVAGLSWSALVATRQLDAVIVAAAVAPAVVLSFLRAPRRDRRPLLRATALAVAAAVPLTGAYLAYNRALTGDPLLAPQQRYMQLKERRGDCFRIGFGPGVGECPLTQSTHFGPAGFRPTHAAANTAKRLDAWNRYSFGWAPLAALPALALVLGGLGLGAGPGLGGASAARRRAFLGVLVAATVGGYALFFYHGVTYGARFYYSALPFALLLSTAAILDLRRRIRPVIAGGLAGALVAALAVGLVGDHGAIQAHAGKRGRSQDGAQIAALTAPGLDDALIFVDSMVLSAAVTEHPAEVTANRPLVVKHLGDASNAGFARLHPGRRPLRLHGTRLVPLSYPADAPMRHEGGALYPLDRFAGGFPDRVPASSVKNLPLSLGEALRFAVDGPGARFAFPVWALAADAGGAMILELRLAHHPRGPAIDVAVDGVPVASGLDTRATGWSMVSHPVEVRLGAGEHWIEIRIPAGTRGDAVFLDFVELRPAPR